MVHEIYPELPGAVGPTAVVAHFAGAWESLTGAATRPAIRERVHAAGAVAELPRAPGKMREATSEDIPVVLRWITAFVEEALDEPVESGDSEAAYRRRVTDPDGAWLLWDDEGPVSLAACTDRLRARGRLGSVVVHDGGSGLETCRERVRPPQPAKPGEIGVGRAQLRSVLDRESGEVRVGDEIAGRAKGLEELTHEEEVPVSRGGDRRARLREPSLDDVERLGGRQRAREDARLGRQPHKREQHRDGESKRLDPREL